MPFDPLPYLAPVFVVALVVEGLAVRYSPRALVSALGCVVLDQITAAWGLVLFLSIFAAVNTCSIVTLEGPLSWLAAIVLHDAAYYAFHRASHRITILWAAHVVHHQSERYDFTVSLRQGSAATWISYAFYLPLAFVIDAEQFLAVHAAYQVYQFFVHTRFVRTLGPLEWLLATPSHHRVHHGSQRSHLDRNYGGFFIVFDRLFGTFTREQREPVYGVPGGFDVASPLAANLYMFVRLAGVRGGLREWLGPPERSTITSAGHAPRPSERAGLLRTWLPLAGGFAAALVTILYSLPTPAAAIIGVAGIVLVEIACSPLDGHR